MTQKPYRGRRVDNEKEIFGFHCVVQGKDYIIPELIKPYKHYGIPFLELVEVHSSSVSQSTGVKDKHGVEIYGGMTLRWRTLRDSENSGGPGIVYWDEKQSGFNVEGFYETFQDCPCCAFSENMTFEIIEGEQT